ncbi:hypothetical protein Lazarus_201 [Acinetobacter phage vB_AbaM_Lazarus]|uniref:Uncharacterized protein n=1 Tax=Acinetobacter phage vB_AbaM_Lazarus TaxID=2686289 RepID=A0A6B9SUQ2_9CAUD|nr:hypothetical protein HYQ23_gp188 [Acinetobacter phage vB_AbaM_Lazarus]QHJ74136.1 hypothetical protein Lazarus_201 [Acinetobacter phage vB_AbaM_Lazarus]
MYQVLLEIHSKICIGQEVAISTSTTLINFDSTFRRDKFIDGLITYENVNGIEVNRIAHTL